MSAWSNPLYRHTGTGTGTSHHSGHSENGSQESLIGEKWHEIETSDIPDHKQHHAAKTQTSTADVEEKKKAAKSTSHQTADASPWAIQGPYSCTYCKTKHNAVEECKHRKKVNQGWMNMASESELRWSSVENEKVTEEEQQKR